MSTTVTITLNGKQVEAQEGEYLLAVARRSGQFIPTLCHLDGLAPYGSCRLCTVKVSKGEWSKFVTACNYPVWDGMEVDTEGQEVQDIRKLVIEALWSRAPQAPVMKQLAKTYKVTEPRFPNQDPDERCILCGLCVRICERMGNGAISLTGRGVEMRVDTPFHVQTDVCLGCGACASVCPTGHIRLEDITRHRVAPIPSEYDMGLTGRKPIYVPYAQAIPNAPAIDRSRCIHFKTGGCRICADICHVFAISVEDDKVVFDDDKCVACGMCMHLCPNKNIEIFQTSDVPLGPRAE